MTPAMAAGVDAELHDIGWIAELTEQAFPEPRPRRKYKPRKK